MKKRKKLLAFSLAAALAVTSVPGDAGRKAEAADTARWIDWNTSAITEGTVEGDTYSLTEECKDTQIPSSQIGENLKNLIQTNDSDIATAMGGSSVSDPSYTYQWFVKTADGEEKITEPDTSSTLNYYDIDDEYKNNAATERTFLCKVMMDSITVDGTPKNLPDDAPSVDAGTYTLKYQYTYKFTGPSQETIQDGTYKLEDFFTDASEKGFQDREEETVYSYSSESSISLRFSELTTKYDISNSDLNTYDFEISYQWSCLAADGTEKTMDTTYNSVSAPLKTNFGKGEEAVAKYRCTATLKYGDAVLKAVKKTFTPIFSPIYVSTPSEKETTKSSRLNGTQTLRVSASFNGSSRGTIKYQWYKIDKDGKETALENETASSMKVRVKDYDTSYKCVLTPKMESSTGGISASPVSRIFKFTSDAGYRLLDKSSSYVRLGVGETKTLSVEAEVDSGFTLKYQWAKYAGYDETTYEEKYEDLGDTGKGNSIQVTAAKSADFIKYRLTVTIEKDNAAVDTHTYDFHLYEDVELNEETNKGTVVAEKGEDVSLYVKTAASGSYTQIKTWYKEIAQAEYTDRVWDSETKKYKYEFADPDFKEPEGYSYTRESEEWEDGKYHRYVVYYQQMTPSDDGATLTLAGKSGDTAVDIQGNYLCHVELYRPENGESKKFSQEDFNFIVVYNSQLYAYAKNKNVKAAVGSAAQLEAVAANKNASLYPITYKWEKRDGSTGDYTVINGADGKPAAGAVLPIASVTEADYGTYRVTVSDSTDEKKILIDLVKSLPVPVDFIPYTAYNNTLVKAMGETAEMNVDISVKQGADPVTDIYYAWYRQDTVYNEDYDIKEQVAWELLGQDTNKYSFTVANDRDYTSYKCVVTYKSGSEAIDKTFYFTLEKPFRFELENLTPKIQQKKLGASADYAVRIVTEDKDIAEKATYQWYRFDVKDDYIAIENATSTTYHVDALAAADFGTLTCKATYKDAAGKEYEESFSFVTNLYTDVKLKKRYETKKVTLGENVTLKPEIDNPGNEKLAYQWYRLGTDDSLALLHGSTGESLALNNIGSEEITEYSCDISCQGIAIATYWVTLTDHMAEEDDSLTAKRADGYQSEVKAILGSSAEFAVQAESAKGLELKYQWFKGYYYDDDYDDAIGGATGSSYKIDKVNPDDYGSYYCQVMDTEGNVARVLFSLSKSTGLKVVNDAYSLEDTIGYEATFGGSVTLTANAACAEGYTPYYQWYYGNKKLYDETSATLTLKNITEDMVGYYSCEISDAKDNTVTQNFYVYVDTGLTVVPGSRYVVASGNTAKMFVKATSKNAITYQWSKYKTVKKGDADYDESLDDWDEGEYDTYIDIPDATKDTYTISSLKKEDYGEYRCVVATRGEKKAFYFDLNPMYSLTANRKFAKQGDSLTLQAAMENAATNADYTYTWYVEQPSTGTYMKADCTTALYQTKAPKILSSDIDGGYCSIGYKCVIEDKKAASDEDKVVDTVSTYVNVLPSVTYETSKLPESNHPFDTEYDIKGYQIKGAKSLNVTFDAKTALDEDETLYVIDSTGNYADFGANDFNGTAKTITVSGEQAIFLINGNSKTASYGYKVTSVKNPASANPGKPSNPGTPKGKKVPAKGKKYTTGNVTYKVTKSAAKNGTVTVSGVKTKKLKSATVKDTVKIDGYTFKVTAIAANAFKGCSKLKSVTIGKNVKTIGANAFSGDKKLKTIKIKGTALKSIGKKAFSKVPKSAKATVPKKKKKAYKKLLKKGKFTGKVK